MKKTTMTLLAKENGTKNCNVSENQTTCRILLIACATALAVACTVALPPAHADDVIPPRVPANIRVPAGNKAFLEGHGDGTQNYICLPCPNPITSDPTKCPQSGFAFTLFTPQATLSNDDDEQVTTHYFSPNLNPTNQGEIKGTIRATWQDSRDTSTVWGKVIQSSSDPKFVASDAIPWLLVQVVGAQDGPTDSNTLSETTFIQRVNTFEGVAPAGCDSRTDVGKQAFVPYTADYFFYKKAAD